MRVYRTRSTIDTTNINEKVYTLLKQRIIFREYPPGHKLNIRELQNELGVSNSPIKHALFKLAGEDFIEILPSDADAFVRNGHAKMGAVIIMDGDFDHASLPREFDRIIQQV